ncbi:MAG: pyruvate kinase, partial [Clostridia bacterium]
VEVPFEELPHIQKNLIHKCYRSGKRAITATQMLDSMIKNPRPTRAETTDVANAVYDGTSAIMLSGETAMGKYPIESLCTMSLIAERAEREIDYVEKLRQMMNFAQPSVTNAISHATCSTAHDLGAAAIVNFTQSGRSARMISSFRPQCPIIACTPNRKVFNQLSMSWGVVSVMGEMQKNTDDLFEHAVQCAMSTGLVRHGDLTVITAGVPLGITGTTNILKVHIVGNVLVTGKGVGMSPASGQLCVCANNKEVKERFREGEILVIQRSSNEILPLLKMARAIVVEEEGVTTPAAIVGLTLDIPVLTGAAGAMRILKSGTTVTVDPNRGFVYSGITNAL